MLGARGIYYGGYPWRDLGILTAADLNAAIATALQAPLTLNPQVVLNAIPDGSLSNAKLMYSYITIGATTIPLGPSNITSLTGISPPVNPSDVATKYYVDNAFGLQGYTAGVGLDLIGNQFNIAATGVNPGTYGTSYAIPQLTVNAEGQITLVGNVAIAMSAQNLTNGTVGSGAVVLNSSPTFTGVVQFQNNISVAGSETIAGNSTIGGNVTINSGLNVAGTVNAGILRVNGARVLSIGGGGNNPSFISYDVSSNTAQGMWSNNGTLFFGSADGAGNPTGSWFNLSPYMCGISGQFQSAGGVIQVSNTSIAPRFCAFSVNGSVNMGFYVDTTQRMMIANFDGNNNATSNNMYIQNGSITITNATAGKPGGGPWADSSDPRIKKIHGTYDTGLDAIRQLRPVEYSFLGNEMTHPASEDRPYDESPHALVAKEGIRFVGLDASDVESVMPEMVSRRKAYIDGEEIEDLRYLDTAPLAYALINAIKTLDARLAAIEGRQQEGTAQ